MLTITGTGNQTVETDVIRNRGQAWGPRGMRYEAQYEIVAIRTRNNRIFNGLRMLPGTLLQEIVDAKTKVAVQGYNHLIFAIQPEYNCFGYVFANSQLLINDVRAQIGILEDEYVEVGAQDSPEIIVFHEWIGFNENGMDVFHPSHAVRIDGPGQFSYKPGITKFVPNTNEDNINDVYNYNARRYYREIP